MKSSLTALALTSAMFLAACSSTASELRSHLRAYGMNKDEARCVSDELTDTLSKRQVKSINRILDAARDDRRARPSRVIRAVEALDDRRVVRAVTIANAGCLILN